MKIAATSLLCVVSDWGIVGDGFKTEYTVLGPVKNESSGLVVLKSSCKSEST